MKYFRLFELQNQYPNINKYNRENTQSSVDALYNHGDAVLKGIFPQNERRFPLSNIAFIRPIANTSIRFILRVKKSPLDEFPRYFTSFNYFAELEQSILSSNPYFLNLSLLDTNIVEFDLTDSITAFKNQIEVEESRNIKMFKNNFLKVIDEKSKDSKTTTYGTDVLSVVKDNEPFVQNTTPNDGVVPRRRLFERNNQNQLLRRPIGDIAETITTGGGQTNIRTAIAQIETINPSNNILSQEDKRPNADGSEFNTQIPNELNVQIGRRRLLLSDGEVNPNVDTKPKSEVEKMIEEVIENPYLDLVDEEYKIYVDYRDLCYYLSWCLSSPTLDSIENNGVLTAQEISKYEFTKKTNDTEKVDNPDPNTGDGINLPTTGKFFEYDIIRLTIPASLEQSKMKFKNQAGEMQEIQTDKYGLVGRFCCEENSWSENHYIYQKTQIGPCPQINSGGGRFGGGNVEPSGYGYTRDYNTRIGAGDFINQERDFRNIQE